MLRVLCCGHSLQYVAMECRIGLSTAHYIFRETCLAIYDSLKSEFLKPPSTLNEWLKIRDDFFSNLNFPNCVGAIDGKHVAIKVIYVVSTFV